MIKQQHHITVCVCTYLRPVLLRRLLDALSLQETNGLFSYSVVVTDNDRLASAQSVVADFKASSQMDVGYFVEPRRGIPRARNTALKHATGDFVAFIDDDEFPVATWLLTLLTVCTSYEVDGVLGPVKRHFDIEPPKWIIDGMFYERPTLPTGLLVEWQKARTGNVLFRRTLVADDREPFRPEFRSGEDQDFFRRMIEKGAVFVWSSEAVVYESVPPVRWQRRFLLRRALLRGESNCLKTTFGIPSLCKSIVAVLAYSFVLPFSACFGQHVFMSRLVRLCDHLGKVLAAMGIRLIREPYITE
jgi:succinoglycan biosynthesis protein ExoM